MAKRLKQSLISLLYALLLLHALWYLAAIMIHKNILPTPFAVYAQVKALGSQNIGWHIYFSLYRLTWSLGIAVIVGVILGVLMARFKKIGQLLSPLIYFTYPIPKIALLPVVMLLFGLGEVSKIIMITLIIVFQVIISVRDAVAGIPEQTYQSLFVLGANRWQLFKNITWPASLAAVISTLRVALGTAIAILFFTETYGTEFGLGYYIMDCWYRLDYLSMYATIVVLSGIAFVLFMILEVIEYQVTKWRR